MAIKFLAGIDLGKNSLDNAVIQNLTTANKPATPVTGQIYYDTTLKDLRVYNEADGAWENVGQYVLPTASTVTKGGVLIDGTTIGIATGVIKVKNGGVGTTQLAADAVDATKIADDAISGEHLDTTVITDQGDLGANLASGDSLLVHDASANSAAGGLAEATIGNLQSYMQSNLTFTTNTDVDVSAENLLTRLAAFDSTDTVRIGDSGNDATVEIRGNLTVTGTTTTVNTETINLADNIILLNSNLADAANATDGGIEVKRGASGSNASLFWDESESRWTMNDGSSSYQIPTADTQRSAESVYDLASSLLTTSASSHTNITATKDDANDAVDLAVATATASAIGVGRVAAATGAISVAVSAGVFTVDVATATADVEGVVELATSAEAVTGTDTARAVTPAGTTAAINANNYVTTLSGTDSDLAYTITHNLGTRDVIVQLTDFGNAGTDATYETVFAEVKRNAVNTCIITFGKAPGTSQDYRVLVTKVVAPD